MHMLTLRVSNVAAARGIHGVPKAKATWSCGEIRDVSSWIFPTLGVED